MEHYLRAWTSGLDDYALQLAHAGLRKTGVVDIPVLPAATLADIPFVKAFVVRYPSASAQIIQDFHDRYQQRRLYYQTYRAKAQEGDLVAAQRVMQLGGARTFTQLDSINQALSQQAHLIRSIYQNPQMSAGDKRLLIDQAYFSMIQVAGAGNDMLTRLDAATK